MPLESEGEHLKERLELLYSEMAYLEEEIADIEAQLINLGYVQEDDDPIEFDAEDFLNEFEDDDDDDDDEELDDFEKGNRL